VGDAPGPTLPHAVGWGFDELVQQPGRADGDAGRCDYRDRGGYSMRRHDGEQGVAENRVDDVKRILMSAKKSATA